MFFKFFKKLIYIILRFLVISILGLFLGSILFFIGVDFVSCVGCIDIIDVISGDTTEAVDLDNLSLESYAMEQIDYQLAEIEENKKENNGVVLVTNLCMETRNEMQNFFNLTWIDLKPDHVVEYEEYLMDIKKEIFNLNKDKSMPIFNSSETFMVNEGKCEVDVDVEGMKEKDVVFAYEYKGENLKVKTFEQFKACVEVEKEKKENLCSNSNSYPYSSDIKKENESLFIFLIVYLSKMWIVSYFKNKNK